MVCVVHISEVDGKKNGISPNYMAHRILVKVEIIEFVSCIQYSTMIKNHKES